MSLNLLFGTLNDPVRGSALDICIFFLLLQRHLSIINKLNSGFKEVRYINSITLEIPLLFNNKLLFPFLL